MAITRHLLPWLGAVSLLAACAPLGPDYQRPSFLPAGGASAEQAALVRYKEAAALLQPVTTAVPARAWWQEFADPTLEAMMGELIANNPTLAQAAARERQAQATLVQARSARVPTLGGNLAVTRSSQPGVGGRTNVTGTSLGLAASWEVDLWGRVRRTIEAGEASATASKADLDAATLSMRAQLVTAYGNLRALDAQAALLDEVVVAYERTLSLTRNRYEAGVAARADVAQAELQWLNAKAQRIDGDSQRAALEHAMAVLLGRPPSAFSLPRVGQFTLAVPPVAASLPSELLRRRPDIVAAERRVAAANAQIGIAVAAWYPTLSLSGSFGERGTTLADLAALPNRIWSLGPALALSLFDGGARDGARAQAMAAYDQTAAAYRQTVLSALADVEDNLAARRVLAQEMEVQREAVRAAQQALTIALNQYKAGTVSYLNVVTAQTAEYTARRSEIALRAQFFATTVSLLRALGG